MRKYLEGQPIEWRKLTNITVLSSTRCYEFLGQINFFLYKVVKTEKKNSQQGANFEAEEEV